MSDRVAGDETPDGQGGGSSESRDPHASSVKAHEPTIRAVLDLIDAASGPYTLEELPQDCLIVHSNGYGTWLCSPAGLQFGTKPLEVAEVAERVTRRLEELSGVSSTQPEGDTSGYIEFIEDPAAVAVGVCKCGHSRSSHGTFGRCQVCFCFFFDASGLAADVSAETEPGKDSGDSRSASVVDKLGWLRDLASREFVSLTRSEVQYVLRAYDGLTSLIPLLEQARLDREAFRNALEYEKSLSKEFSARARVRLSIARGVMQDADDGNLPVPGLVAYFEQANEEMDAEWHAQGMEP